METLLYAHEGHRRLLLVWKENGSRISNTLDEGEMKDPELKKEKRKRKCVESTESVLKN